MRILFFCVLLAATATFGGGPSREQVEAYLVSQGRSFTAARQAFEVDSTAGPEVGLAQTYGDVFIAWWAVEGVEQPDSGALPSYEEALEILAAAQDVELQDAKSQDQKILENEYFALVEEIYDSAGEEAPDLETAKNLGQARAKIAKARQNKPGTGQGGEKTVDDVLEFLDMQMRLQALELELRGYDPNWRRLARKHVLE